MNLFLIKIAFALVIFVLGWVGALLSLLPRRGGPSVKFMAGLIHLLSGGMDAFQRMAPTQQYPFALLLAGAGFLLILLIEGVIVTGPPAATLHGSYHSVGTRHELVESEQE